MLAMGKGLNISYSDVFDNPTVIDLAALALSQGHKEESKKEDLVPIKQGLENNVIAKVDEVTEGLADFKVILLTGATGFLGIHILHELLVNSKAKILALVRGSKTISGKERLHGLLEYYFDNPFIEEMDERVQILEADVTNENLLDVLKDVKFELIVNCAAVVKHFSNSDAIEKVNFGGVKNLIEVALEHKAREGQAHP